jgi:hypothetical protein
LLRAFFFLFRSAMHAGTELRDRGVCWQPRQETAAEEKKIDGKGDGKDTQDQQRTTKLVRQFNPNTYRMKVRG